MRVPDVLLALAAMPPKPISNSGLRLPLEVKFPCAQPNATSSYPKNLSNAPSKPKYSNYLRYREIKYGTNSIWRSVLGTERVGSDFGEKVARFFFLRYAGK